MLLVRNKRVKVQRINHASGSVFVYRRWNARWRLRGGSTRHSKHSERRRRPRKGFLHQRSQPMDYESCSTPPQRSSQ
ncbi:hypothetical protein PUN28_011691 [Cardiocondyla obscurior]|uniref:Uncharacterized protein n=1 Tax=Cardiocondyla obscurior TaxID=286306 RepID=A0AAW2FH48_9HYME